MVYQQMLLFLEFCSCVVYQNGHELQSKYKCCCFGGLFRTCPWCGGLALGAWWCHRCPDAGSRSCLPNSETRCLLHPMHPQTTVGHKPLPTPPTFFFFIKPKFIAGVEFSARKGQVLCRNINLCRYRGMTA